MTKQTIFRYFPIFSKEDASSSGNIELDFSEAGYVSLGPVTGDIAFSGTNYSKSSSIVVRLIGGATDFNITYPPGWVEVSDLPTKILAGKTAILTVTSFGTLEEDCILVWADGEPGPGGAGHMFVERLYITSSSDFFKVNYPWLRAIGAHVLGGGGSGGVADATGTGQYVTSSGGASGVYAYRFITNINAVPDTAGVVVGAGGFTIQGNTPTGGFASSFQYTDSLSVSANGGTYGASGWPGDGGGAYSTTSTTQSSTVANADFSINGSRGQSGFMIYPSMVVPGSGGNAPGPFGGAGGTGHTSGGVGSAGHRGGGGGGSSNLASSGDKGGGVGGDGIVVLDLYA